MINKIRLNESKLTNIIKESVINILNEMNGYTDTMNNASWYTRHFDPRYKKIRDMGDKRYDDATSDLVDTLNSNKDGHHFGPEEEEHMKNLNMIRNKYDKYKMKYNGIKSDGYVIHRDDI